jgi:hypothetical protein
MTTTTTTADTTLRNDDPDYEDYLAALQARFLANAAGQKLFTVAAPDLYDAFLIRLPAEERQYHRCAACRRFVERFGGLVTIDEQGHTHSAVWSVADAPPIYAQAVAELIRVIEHARVTGVFYSSDPVWGTPIAGGWRHLALTPPPDHIMQHGKLSTPALLRAQKRQDYETLLGGLTEFSEDTIQQAVILIRGEALVRPELVLDVALWLQQLQQARASTRNTRCRENLVWRAVASAPSGWCHPKTTLIGTVLEDIAAGVALPLIRARFAAKVGPLAYQRPKAPPTAGNIAQAEKIVEQLGIAPALARRYARLDEIQTVWRSAPPRPEPAAQGGGVFGHLLPKAHKTQSAPPIDTLAPIRMTWEKFARTVLPTARAIRFFVPAAPDNYCAILTATDPDARPILQWDTGEQRNPFSWYLYVQQSAPANWGLQPGTWCAVNAITLQPSMWFDSAERFESQGKAVIFVLDGAKDQRAEHVSLCLFPANLRGELHSVRATIEAFSKNGRLTGIEEASACGIRLEDRQMWDKIVSVTATDGAVASTLTYMLDRWD